MTQLQFNKVFKQTYPNYKVMTQTDRCLYYNDMAEDYRRNGYITEKQAYRWAHPEFLTTNIDKIDCNAY